MDTIFIDYLQQLEQIRATHPTIYSVWKKYIEMKQERMNLLSIRLNKVVDSCIKKEVEDFSQEQLLLMYTLQQHIE